MPADVPMNEKHYAYMRDPVPLRCRHVVQGDVLVRLFLEWHYAEVADDDEM